ncbi:MAG: glycosyltransferase [Fibrobacteraceae bacterium]|nr:glycosyltransferase [Fibrobacteraceae bacterium]
MCTGIVILNYNNIEDTLNCVDSVNKYNTASIKIVIVDNGSEIKKFELLKECLKNLYNNDFVEVFADIEKTVLKRCSLVRSNRNLGYACGNNIGIDLLKKDPTIKQLMILNNDILFVEDIIPRLSLLLEEDPKIGIVSPLLYKKNLLSIDYNCARKRSTYKDIIKWLWSDVPFALFHRSLDANKIFKLNPELLEKNRVEIELPSGSCMLMLKETAYKIKLFNPNTFLYYEENILYEEELRSGFRNFIVPSLSCIHLGASSTKTKTSKFLIKCSKNSMHYFLSNYFNLSPVRKSFLEVSFFWYVFSHRLLDGLIFLSKKSKRLYQTLVLF